MNLELAISNPVGFRHGWFVFLSWMILALGCSPRVEPLPKLFQLPSAELVSHTGAPTTIDDLRGNVVIYDFIFTRCAGTCPMMTRKMEMLTTRLQGETGIRFISVSVDPEWDTVQRLSEYKARFSADTRWLFLTGERDVVMKLSVDGFKLAAGDDPENGVEPFLHSSRFVLVDGDGVIRGYYDSFVEGAMERLESDARSLLD